MNYRKYPSALVAALVLAITPQSAQAITYAAWIASYGLTGADALEDADPDQDGMPNLIEYALDTGSPVVGSGYASALPVLGYAIRTGNAMGAWSWSVQQGSGFSIPLNTGIGGVYHSALRWRPRPGVEGIRYQPELSNELLYWYSGRSCILNESIPGNIVQSTSLRPYNGQRKAFMRLRIVTDPTVGNALAGITATGISTQGLDIGLALAQPRATSQESTSSITVGDTLVTRRTGANTITDYSWAWAASANNLQPVNLVRTSSNPAVIIPNPADPYGWTAVGAGTATLTLSTDSNTYNAPVTVALGTGETVDTVTGFTPTSLRAHLVAQIDPQLAGKTAATALQLYSSQDHTTPAYVRNTACWAAPYVSALTAISPWNSQGGNQYAGILISPRHVLFATHYAAGVGAVMRFVGAGNTVVERTITARQSVTITSGYHPDLTIGVLDSDVPASIDYARVLPDNWATYLPNLSTVSLRVPSLGLDAEEKALVSDLADQGTMAQFISPTDTQRRAFYEDKIGGDSSNPACLIINSQLVVLTCWTYGGGGSGSFVTGQRTALNAIMASLGGGYTLTDADLSGFPTY